MKYLIAILMILFFVDLAQAEWFCSSVSTEKNGNTYLSCGIGYGPDESEARANALIVAKTEFKAVCVGSSDCEGREVSIQPERTTCIKKDEGYSCHRMVIFTVGKPLDEKKSIEADKEAKPFSYIETQDKPKAKIGMVKQAFLKVFGSPIQITRRYTGEIVMMFQNKSFCSETRGFCHATFDQDKLTRLDGFHLASTEELK